MKPILYEANTTEFDGMGLGVLSDCISCPVTEERNGIFEVEFTVPITGIHYSEITKGRIVLISHDETKVPQPFIIYHISKPISGIVTVNAHHISYDLNHVVVAPFEADSIQDAFEGCQTYAMTENPFTFWTDKTSGGDFTVKVPTSVRSLLGGTQGSILDAFGGGEYEFDNFLVKLHQNRGYDSGVTISYGKNLTDIVEDTDSLSLYSAVVPFWSNGADVVVFGGIVQGEGGIRQVTTWTDEDGLPMQDENGSVFEFHTYLSKVVPMDLTAEFEDAPTVAQLEARAETILNANKPWIPRTNITVDFVALWQTEEYKNIAPLERVRLCDTVHVKYTALGVEATAKVIKTVWNPLLERYDEIELGDAKTSFADAIMAETDIKLEEIPSFTEMNRAIANATSLITGGMGGNIVFLYDTEGKPTDLLAMDTDDPVTAVHVLRINVNGIGFSSNGVQGPYTSAWTLQGVFNADFIVAGQMSASRIHGGTLVLGGAGDNTNGSIVVYNASGDVIGRWNNNGIEINGGVIRTSDGTRTSTIESGYTKYYSGKFIGGTPKYIGDIGVMTSFNGTDDKGLGFSLTDDGDYIGWFVDNGGSSYDPVLIYSRDSYLNIDIWADSITALCDFHVADGYCLSGTRIEDPGWKFSGANYAGYTGNVTINNVRMTFKNGVLTSAANT